MRMKKIVMVVPATLAAPIMELVADQATELTMSEADSSNGRAPPRQIRRVKVGERLTDVVMAQFSPGLRLTADQIHDRVQKIRPGTSTSPAISKVVTAGRLTRTGRRGSYVYSLA